jgi:ABC-type nitrate/sulfonate/bicarbonate transport system ATPase subunit
MISLEHVTFAYPHRPLIFQDYTWQAQRGQSWAILGPSGSGKTTLLYLLAGLRFPSDGQVLVDDAQLLRPRPQTGLILQDYGLLPWNTVFDNIRLGQRIRSFYGPDGRHAPPQPEELAASAELPRQWMERLGLSEFAGQYPAQLSGGQRQRTAIARTLALQPDLLLMDEPFSSLDAATRQDLRELTLTLWREQSFTFVVVTHAIEEAANLGQFILILSDPPHRQPLIIENPCFGRSDLEEDPDYRTLLRQLRAHLSSSSLKTGLV